MVRMPDASPRCGTCGYRRLGSTSARCPECGVNRPPIVPPSRDALRRSMLKWIGLVLLGWLALFLPPVMAHVAVALESMGLFVLAALATPVIAAACIGTAFVTAGTHQHIVLDAIWIARDGRIGPWSRPMVRVAACFLLVALQLIGLAVMYVLSMLAFPSWPSGWP